MTTKSAEIAQLSRDEQAAAMADYIRAGEARAHALGNRGPIKLNADGKLSDDILKAYWRVGFYVLEDVVGGAELADLKADVEKVLAAAPVAGQSLSEEERALAEWADAHAAEAIELIRDVVNLNSGTLNLDGVRRVGDVFRAEFDALGLQTTWSDQAEVGRAGHLIAGQVYFPHNTGFE